MQYLLTVMPFFYLGCMRKLITLHFVNFFFRNLMHRDMVETETPLNLIWTNTSNISELLSTSSNDSDQQDPLVKIKEMIWFISHPILIILGTFGNVLVFIVMRRGTLKNVSTCFYMSILALADTGISILRNV